MPPDAGHFSTVAGAIRDGDVVPVLGAGANLCDRIGPEPWTPGKTLPSGRELSERLAKHFFNTPPLKVVQDPGDLLRVASAAALNRGPDALFRELRNVFARDEVQNTYEPTSLHRFLAQLPKLRRDNGLPARPQLIVSTNYDDLLEQAFTLVDEPFDLVYYLAQGEGGGGKDQGRFVHVPPAGQGPRKVVKTPKSYLEVTPDKQTVILKIHGAVRREPEEDSWVISEDHYIDYLTRTNLSQLFPALLLKKLLKGNLLFLGYAMNDWNLRVILHRICAERNNKVPAWAIQLEADTLDRELWEDKQVDIHCMPLSDYVKELSSSLRSMVSS